MYRRAIARGRKSAARRPVARRRARKVVRHCIPYIALRSWRPPGRMLRRTMARGGNPQHDGLWPDGARKSDAALHPMHCVSGAAIPVRLALLGARYGLCEPLVSPFAPRKNETFAERKATNFAKAISDDPFESAGVVGEATALLNSKIKAGNFLVKVQEVRLKQEAAARNAIEARTKAMEEYRTQFVDHAAARAGSTHRGEAPRAERRAGTEMVGAEMETDTATVAEELRGVDQRRPAEAGTPTSRAVAEESRGVDQARPAEAGTPTSRAVAEESRGVDQARPAEAGTPTSAAVAEESRGVDQARPAEAGTPTSRAVAEESRGVDQARPAEAGTPTSPAVAEKSRGVDQARPAEAGTPTSAAVAEESRGVDQARPAEAGTPTSRAVAEESRGVDQARPAEAGTPTSRAVAEESRGVDQGRWAKAHPTTPTSAAVAEKSRGVDQRRPAEAGTATSAAVAEESRGVDQRRPAEAGTPTSAAFAEKPRGVDQGRTNASGKEPLS